MARTARPVPVQPCGRTPRAREVLCDVLLPALVAELPAVGMPFSEAAAPPIANPLTPPYLQVTDLRLTPISQPRSAR